MDASQGDVKRQVSNTVKAVMATYKFRTMGEYRALLSLYNVTVEEARGMVNGREYHGLVYSATDDGGNKVGNPFKASCIGKSVGYEAVLRRFEYPNAQIRDKRLADMTRKTVAAVLDRTYRKDEFVALLKAKGVDVVFRHTDGGRIYGATFIDHRTGCVLNGSRLGREFSANALQEHFTLPYADTPPMPFTLTRDEPQAEAHTYVEHGESIPRAWACLAATHRAHRRKKPPSSANSNASGRNAGRVWDYKLSVRRASKQRSDLWLSKVRPLVASPRT